MVPCEEGADSATKQHRSNGKARGRRPGAEGVRQGVYGTVDDAAVETEEKAADGSYRAKHDDVDRGARRGVERRGSARGRRYAPGQVSFDSFYWFIHGKVLFQQWLPVRLTQKLTPVWKPTTTALEIWPVPPGRMMYCRSGWKKNASPRNRRR